MCGKGRSALSFAQRLLSDPGVRVPGVGDGADLGALEWWRIVEIEPPRRARLIFIEQAAAEDYAAHLAAERGQVILLEHWREQVLVDVRLVVRPRSG